MPDSRGHGKSFTEQSDFSLETASEDIVKLISQLKLDKPIIMGHSMGGQIATLIAGSYPNLVSKIILEDPAYLLKEKSIKMQIISTAFKYMIKRGMKKTEEQLRKQCRRLNRSWDEEDVVTWATGQKEFSMNNPLTVFENLSADVDWHDIFPKIAAPTLLIIPSKGILNLKDAEIIAPEFQNAEIAFIEKAGHSVRRENFKKFMVSVTTFLNNT
jgi:pimeloyl-ACP methyl ester carboxylesterase